MWVGENLEFTDDECIKSGWAQCIFHSTATCSQYLVCPANTLTSWCWIYLNTLSFLYHINWTYDTIYQVSFPPKYSNQYTNWIINKQLNKGKHLDTTYLIVLEYNLLSSVLDMKGRSVSRWQQSRFLIGAFLSSGYNWESSVYQGTLLAHVILQSQYPEIRHDCCPGAIWKLHASHLNIQRFAFLPGIKAGVMGYNCPRQQLRVKSRHREWLREMQYCLKMR